MKRILFILLFLPLFLQAQLGTLPARTTMRAYYHLDGTTDASGNSRTLTNTGSVAFNPSKFANGADFGTTGTAKILSVGINPLSALQVTNLTISLWFRLNSTANTTANGLLLCAVSTLNTGGVTASTIQMYYTILSGVLRIRGFDRLTTTSSDAAFIATNDLTTWYNVVLLKAGTTITLYVNGNNVATNTGTGTESGSLTAAFLAIGNVQTSTPSLQALAIIDEAIFEERLWTASEIRKYYSQALGRFAPK